ncbi:uroporphyrinogen-III C-methyltransferase [Marinicrinis sediminis]|uniref:uroporphyrinogen-III C-methyltransferase n=1 Tax=Marinicrinis sediminis TaxID=1652465 RepID=A0ABW5R6I0_9BACL
MGKVYLTGAGPGDPKLITVRGMETIQLADVLIYDRLVSEHLLKLAPANTEKIFVGKEPGCHHKKQEEIQALLVEKAMQGKLVTRLKGGDPFIFGRGGEEAVYLQQVGIPFEVVPGISSFSAVPAYAGIPITHRHKAASFTVIPGHHCEENALQIDWEASCQSDTLVILMGMRRFDWIHQQLMAYKPPSTPIALIQQGTTVEQRVVEGDLGTIMDRLAAQPLQNPVVIVVGEVVRLRQEMLWYK